MSWALKRQIFYLSILIILFLGLGFAVAYPRLNRAPSCTDGRSNGNETGIDCGGSCINACINDVEDVSILWARSFEVVPARYNAMAYLQNHNKNAVIDKINYRFRFADKNNVYIGKREGTTFVPPGGNFAIFEGGIDMGGSIPVYTTFEFLNSPAWTQVSADKVEQLKMVVSNINLQNDTTSPHLTATLKNNSLLFIPEVNVIAILYDASHNAVSASRTIISELAPEEAKNIGFTWPQPFTIPIVAKEIIPIYNIKLVEWQ